MDKQKQAISNDFGTLAEDASNLVTATAGVVSDEVSEARKRLAAALERGKEISGRVREKAVESLKATDQTVRENPYQAIGIALGLGVLIGYLVTRRSSRRD